MAFHEPYYTTQSSPVLAKYLKQNLEQLFYKTAVDVVVNGHIHAYERSFPVYKNVVRTIATSGRVIAGRKSGKARDSAHGIVEILCFQIEPLL